MSEPIIPTVPPELEPFFAAAKEGRLEVQRCVSCGTLRFPARGLCAKCLWTESEWTPVSGRGEVYSFFWMHQVYHPAYAGEVPYAVVVTRLEEGPRMMTNILDCPKEELRVGLPVEVVFEPRGTDVCLPQFRPRRA
ncbi:MAG: OB-fold domain-containing protein [Candidatus Binatia bacterium]|nr:OB-fold domain-containing protein [Candidatus Binatia bacterium]